MPTENEEKMTVCDILNYEKDIEPYPLIKIYAGVGSGKSHFAGRMVTGSKEYSKDVKTSAVDRGYTDYSSEYMKTEAQKIDYKI